MHDEEQVQIVLPKIRIIFFRRLLALYYWHSMNPSLIYQHQRILEPVPNYPENEIFSKSRKYLEIYPKN